MSEVRFYPINRDSSYYEHMHRYLFAQKLVKDMNVLDISCGEGYGSDLLTQEAKSVIGCDIDEEIIVSASAKYSKNSKLNFRVGDCTKMPFENKSFDVIVSFETIEHFEEHEKFLKEVKRVLLDDGILIISSPDKTVYSDKRNYHNPDHVKELTKQELVDLLKQFFNNIEVLGQRFVRNSLISKLDEEHINFEKIQVDKDVESMFVILVCSNKKIIIWKLIILYLQMMVQIMNLLMRWKG